MSDIIHLLPDSVANQIAAGEVIQRPASVLKELVENAIDAGATFIQIAIKDAGRTLIQVVDNGKGMSETDARMAFERHATSKIKSADDLFSIRTMGFRGEALASIAAVAQVELKTRRENDELGVSIEIAGTRVFKQEAVMCDSGTSFQVKNLFFNVPARRRFMKSDNVEKSHLLNEFYRIALVNTSVGFSLNDGDEEIYNLPASNTKIRIESIFGKNARKKWQQQLLTIETTTNLVSISGFVGKPEFAQKSANQYFFVNGRYMRHPYFHKAVLLAYNQMIQSTDSPNYFIYFEVDPQSIDINIHPTKTEIKFENEQAIWSILTAAIKEALGKFNIVPSIDFDQEGAPEMPVNTQYDTIRPPQTNFNPNYNPFGNSGYKRPDLNWEELYGGFQKDNSPEQATMIEWKSDIDSSGFDSGSSDLNPTIDTPETKADVFQYKNKYILTGIKSGLLLIDQQRAHTRVLFDQILSQLENAKGISQQVLFPEVMEFSTEENLYFEQLLEDLKQVGFDFDPLENHAYWVKGVPSIIGTGSVSDILYEMLENAKTTSLETTAGIHETIAIALAKASSIQSGQHLSNEEMSNLIDRLFACANYNFTPDGKKISIILSQQELEAKFR